MREIDLSKYQIRTDLVVDLIEKDYKFEKKFEYDFCSVSRITLDEVASSTLNKKAGDYTTLHFKDITDSTNFNNVLKVLTSELKVILKDTKISKDSSCMIIGLGNYRSTADELGVRVSEKVLVTKHILSE